MIKYACADEILAVAHEVDVELIATARVHVQGEDVETVDRDSEGRVVFVVVIARVGYGAVEHLGGFALYAGGVVEGESGERDQVVHLLVGRAKGRFCTEKMNAKIFCSIILSLYR